MNKHEVANSIPQVPAHGADWPNPSERCWCEECTEVRRIRSAAALATRAQCFADGLIASIHHDIGTHNLRLRHNGFGVDLTGSTHAINSAMKALDSHMSLRMFFNRIRDSVKECAMSILE